MIDAKKIAENIWKECKPGTHHQLDEFIKALEAAFKAGQESVLNEKLDEFIKHQDTVPWDWMSDGKRNYIQGAKAFVKLLLESK